MLSSRVVDGDATEEGEDDEDGIRFATLLVSQFKNKETVLNW